MANQGNFMQSVTTSLIRVRQIISSVSKSLSFIGNVNSLTNKATITRCDLLPRFFCIDATLLCKFESGKI